MKIYPLTGSSSGKSGSGSARVAQEDKNTLRSRAYARFIDLLSEGPIEGFVTQSGIVIRDCTLNGSAAVVGGSVTLGTLSVSSESAGYPYNPADPIYCLIDGDGSGAKIRVDVWPTATYPEGRVKQLVVESGGTGYTEVSVSLPPAVGQAVFFDDIPLCNPANLAPNFVDVKLEYRTGIQDQTPMVGFEQVDKLFDNVNTSVITHQNTVLDNTPWMHSELGVLFDRVAVTLSFEALYRQDPSNGDILIIAGEYSPTVKIEYRVRPEGGSFSSWISFGSGSYTITGKTMSRYERTIVSNIARPGSGRYDLDVRVIRTTTDDPDSTRHTKFSVGSMTGITNANLQYPYSAIVGVEINAEQFSAIPTRSYNVKLLRVQVPSNYFPQGTIKEITQANGTVVRSIRAMPEYCRNAATGLGVYDANGKPVDQIWDGGFYEAWTDNPAWIAYALLTDTRWGLGRHIPGADKWAHYTIAKYCDDPVKTGADGSTEERRFTCNTMFQTTEEAFKVLTDLASTFAGFYYFGSGMFVPVQDRPRKSRMIFTHANVVDGLFEYKGTQLRARHTTALVQFSDPANGYKLAQLYYDEPDSIMRYGVNQLSVVAFGCTSRGQARRLARRALKQEIANTDTITFSTGIQGSVLRPGDVIEVYDSLRSALPFGGRVLALSSVAGKFMVSLDREITDSDFVQGNAGDYSIVFSVPLPDVASTDTTSGKQVAQITNPFPIVSISRNVETRRHTVTVDQLSSDVAVGCLWGLRKTTVSPQLFSVVGVEETAKGVFSILGIEYHDAIYDYIDKDANYSETSIAESLDAWKIPAPVTNLQVYSTWLATNSGGTATVSWTTPSSGFAKEFEVWSKRTGGTFKFETRSRNTCVDVFIPRIGSYVIRVYAIGLTGLRSQQTDITFIAGADPVSLTGEIVSGLEIRGQDNNNEFYSADLELDWRVNSSMATDTFQQGAPPILPPGIVGYRLSFVDLDSNAEVLVVNSVPTTSYTLTASQNASLPDGPFRNLEIEVRAISVDGGASKPTTLTVFNAKPPVPEAVIEADDNGQVVITIDPSSAKDFGGYRVWLSENSGFDPHTPGTLKYQGTSNVVQLRVEHGRTYYVKYAEFDLLSNSEWDCNISNQAQFTGRVKQRLSVFDFVWKSGAR